MAYRRTLYCLAIAIHERRRTVAGKTPEGEWMRPVLDSSHETLSPGECRYSTGATPQILDVMSISFDRPEPEGHQQEKHVVALEPWERAGELDYEELSALAESPRSLWGSTNGSSSARNDAVTPETAKGFDHSLLLIKPEALQIRVGAEGGLYQRLVVRAVFRYRGQEYALPVADERAQDAFSDKGLGHYKLDAYLCLGLSRPSVRDGLCHKLVLGVISQDRF